MLVQSCCLLIKTFCFFAVLVAVALSLLKLRNIMGELSLIGRILAFPFFFFGELDGGGGDDVYGKAYFWNFTVYFLLKFSIDS